MTDPTRMHACDLNGTHLGRRITIRRENGDGEILITAPVRKIVQRDDAVHVHLADVRPPQNPIMRAFGNPPPDAYVLDPDDRVLLEPHEYTQALLAATEPAVESVEQ